MLKKTLLAAAICGLAVTAVQANEVSGYLTASVGQAKAEKSKAAKFVQSEWKELGGSTSTNRSSTGHKIVVGLNVNPNLALELQYTDLGKETYKGRNSDSYPNGSWNESEKLDMKTRGLGANIVGIIPIEDFTLFGKAGYHSLRTKASYKYNDTDTFMGVTDVYSESASKTVTKWAPLIGVGASYDMTPELSVVAEYERYHKVANKKVDGVSLKHDIDFASVGLRYSF